MPSVAAFTPRGSLNGKLGRDGCQRIEPFYEAAKVSVSGYRRANCGSQHIERPLSLGRRRPLHDHIDVNSVLISKAQRGQNRLRLAWIAVAQDDEPAFTHSGRTSLRSHDD